MEKHLQPPNQKYTAPIKITSTTTLKFMAVDWANNHSLVYTKTYKIDKIAPIIVSSIPKDLATGYSKTSAVSLKFNENIKTGTNWSKITVTNLNTRQKISITAKSIMNNTLYI